MHSKNIWTAFISGAVLAAALVYGIITLEDRMAIVRVQAIADTLSKVAPDCIAAYKSSEKK